MLKKSNLRWIAETVPMNCNWFAVSILDIWNQKQSFLLFIHFKVQCIHVDMQYNAAKSRSGWKEVTNWPAHFRCLCHCLREVIYFHFMFGYTGRDDKVWNEKIEKYQEKTSFFVWFYFHWFKSGMLCDEQQTDNIRFSFFNLCYEPLYNYFLFFHIFLWCWCYLFSCFNIFLFCYFIDFACWTFAQKKSTNSRYTWCTLLSVRAV